MKRKTLAIVSVLIVALLLLNYAFLGKAQIEESPDFFVGVDVAYPDLEATKKLIDKVSSYTNLFVIGSTGISDDYVKLDETCQYLYDKGLSFIIYTEKSFQHEWFESAKNRCPKIFWGSISLMRQEEDS